ncbi:sodium-independent sulfate anion transporter-like isoform X1 [Teleopsis dalmanni]|uniref:sodium-independent sulfate anion transporter-like isoform X1 n=1 Tax=Teleopsis dalmanni TaxID=139649 RepID=UPI000D32C61E|nr:sodium-independent sulfate anion transporter-like isoform X1 [Teleopsis dalmanni]
MSTLENQAPFRKTSRIEEPVESQFNGSTEFILITDHQTTLHKSLEQLETKTETSCCKAYVKNVFRKKTLYKRLPILQWLPNYTTTDAIGDLIAGITVGLTVIPQGLAYAGVAGLPSEYGLYGSFMGCFVYVLLGTCKDSTIGSTAIASLLVYQIAQGVWQRAVLLTFITGIIEIFMAIFKLGFLVEFVSGPVSAGFTSAVALIISTSQIKSMLGVKSGGTTFLERWITIIRNIRNIRVPDTLLGISCVLILIVMRSIGRIKMAPKVLKWYHKLINKSLWFLGVTRNASLVILCTVIVSKLEKENNHYFRLTGHVPLGLPEFGLPPFSINSVPANVTFEDEEVKGETFMEMINSLGYGLIIVPLIALLENIAVCKAFAKGKPIDATQELFAIGVSNIANSLCKGYRANGGLARSAVNNASGVRTPMGNLYIGLVVVVALMYLTEYFYYIPKAVLAAIIISAVIFQLQYHVIVPMWRSKRSDLIPGFVAFIACLVLPLEIGILVAIGVNLLFILYHSARPKVSLETLETNDGLKFLKLTPDRCLIFPSVESVRNLVIKSGIKTTLPVVIDCTYIYGADFTAAKVISSMIEDFNKRDQKIIFFNLKPSVVQIFEGLNTKLKLCYNIHALSQELKAGTEPTNLPETIVIEGETTSPCNGGIDLTKL